MSLVLYGYLTAKKADSINDLEMWENAYAVLCQSPAMSAIDLVIKIHALLDEHETGETIYGADLRESIRRALPMTECMKTGC